MPSFSASGITSKARGTICRRWTCRLTLLNQRAAATGRSRAMVARMVCKSWSAVSENSTRCLLFLAKAELLEHLLRRFNPPGSHVLHALIQHARQREQVHHPFVAGDVQQDRRRLAILGNDDRLPFLTDLFQDLVRLLSQFRRRLEVFLQTEC